MPKPAIKNPFARRKSSSNVLEQDVESPPPAQSSFRVIERPEKSATINFDDPKRNSYIARLNDAQRPFTSPLQHLRGRSVDNLSHGSNPVADPAPGHAAPSLLKAGRASGGTTVSASSEYHHSSSASARYSSGSTLPSSPDHERPSEDDDLFAKKRPLPHSSKSAHLPAGDSLPPPPSFSTRATRALSFGLKNKQQQQQQQQHQPAPAAASPLPVASANSSLSSSPTRQRAMTNSSYASTAVPLRLDTKPDLGASDFGSDFGNMFDGMAQRRIGDGPPQPPPSLPAFHRTESEPMYPPRSYSRQGSLPSPTAARSGRDANDSPYSWDRRNSRDGLMSSSALSSPCADHPPAAPPHGSGIAPAFFSSSKQGYSLVPETYSSPAPERTSQDSQSAFMEGSDKSSSPDYANRQSQLADGDRWASKHELLNTHNGENRPPTSTKTVSLVTPSSSAGPSASLPTSHAVADARPGATSPGSSEGGSLWDKDSSNATPKARKAQLNVDEPLFDDSPAGPPSRAIRPEPSPISKSDTGTPKRLTKAQFDRLRRDHHPDTSEDGGASGEEDDDEDETERAKQVTKQRRKQEANMAIYRQQMKKVTGGGPTDLPPTRPGLDRGHTSGTMSGSMSSLHLGGVSGAPPQADPQRGNRVDDDDEDTPLAILQAHGFPSGTRPPTRLAGEEPPQIRRGSAAPSVIAGGPAAGQNLPPFARRLPEDPYFGAGLVNPATRESLAFGGAASVYGGPAGMSAGGQPGGLVGVIASEERQRQARRGSPNPNTGTYPSMPLPANMGSMQRPGMDRTASTASFAIPPGYSPSGSPVPMMMPQMPQMPMMESPQMQQFMQMQMQFMQSMFQMQQANMGQPPIPPHLQQQPPNFPGGPGAAFRPTSMDQQSTLQRPGANQPRAMTMLTPPSNWGAGAATARPNSSFDLRSASYAPSMHGLNGPAPAQGYTPSLAPSERSNVGMASRYRPVQTGDAATAGGSRTQSLTSSQTLNAFQSQQASANGTRQHQQQQQQQQQPATSQQINAQAQQPKNSTIRIIDKPKGTPKIATRQVVDPDEDEEEGWAELAKKRDAKTFRRAKNGKAADAELSELYHGVD